MIEEGQKNTKSFHLAGVVPIAGQPLEFNFPWHDSLMPIGENFLAVERVVAECAAAGCETIWVVCHKGTQPLIRHRLGEWAIDPASLDLGGLYAAEKVKRIPIFYVPIHPNDRRKRDCLGWSVLYGALTAYRVSAGLSKWVIPDKYYAAFPFGVYPLDVVKAGRKKFSSKENFCLTFDSNSVKNGEYLGFTFGAEDFKRCRDIIKKEGTNLWSNRKRIPLEKRYSAQNFSLDKVFEGVIIENKIELPWYYNIDSWEGYREFFASEHNKLAKPKEMRYGEWNIIGEDGEPRTGL